MGKGKCAILMFLVAVSFLGRELAAQNHDREAADLGRLFIETINSGSETEQGEMVARLYSPTALAQPGREKLLGLFAKLHRDYAPLELHHAEILEFPKATGVVYVMHVYARKRGDAMWKDFQFYLDPTPPRRISALAFIAEVAEPISLPNGLIRQPETLAWLEKYIGKLQAETGLSGSILIAGEQGVLFEKYFGHADPGRKVPITRETLFNTASGGKMFTALAVARLVESGKLNYGDSIAKYLDGFADKARAEKITLHHLLSHTSGINEYWSGAEDEAVFGAAGIADHLRLVYRAGLSSAPGSEYAYCNSNYIVLGAIIEKASGRTFYDFVQQEIFKIAGMTASGYFPHDAPGAARPLARGEKQNTWVEAARGIRGSSAGGAYTHAADMLKFSNSLRNYSLVSGATLKNMTSAKNLGLDAGEEYGYGFILLKTAGEETFGHGGTANGVNFEFRYFPGQKITLVVFCNQNNGAYDDLKKNAIKLISGAR